jgi:aryl-alcohol dehydrogenase-like predicted oxidoreductase
LDLGNAGGRDRVISLLRRAMELGVNHIDTAPFYLTYARDQPIHDFTPLNWANEMIHRALAPYPGDLVIATKVGPAAGGRGRMSCTGRSKKTCASSAEATLTWCTCAKLASTQSLSTSAHSPNCATPG